MCLGIRSNDEDKAREHSLPLNVVWEDGSQKDYIWSFLHLRPNRLVM